MSTFSRTTHSWPSRCSRTVAGGSVVDSFSHASVQLASSALSESVGSRGGSGGVSLQLSPMIRQRHASTYFVMFFSEETIGYSGVNSTCRQFERQAGDFSISSYIISIRQRAIWCAPNSLTFPECNLTLRADTVKKFLELPFCLIAFLISCASTKAFSRQIFSSI